MFSLEILTLLPIGNLNISTLFKRAKIIYIFIWGHGIGSALAKFDSSERAQPDHHLQQEWPTQMILRATLEMHHNSAGRTQNYISPYIFTIDIFLE